MTADRPRLLPPTFRTLQALGRWPVASQQRARRNALLASTALTQARHERDEVEEYLAGYVRRWERAREIVEHRAAH